MDIGNRQKNILYFGVSTLIIAALIYFAEVGKFLESLRSAKTLPLATGILFGVSGFTILGYTWHRFLHKIELDTNYPKSFQLFMSGQFMNSVTPLGQLGGEPVMAYIVQDTQNTSYEEALSAVVSADIINTVPYITFMLGGAAYLLLFDSLNATVAKTATVAGAITLLGGFLTYLLWFRADILEEKISILADRFVDLTGRGEKRVQGLNQRLEHLRETFDSISEDPRHLVSTALVAHLFFVMQVAALFFVIQSVSQSADLTALYFVVAVSSLANFSPTPGGSGTFEAAMAGVLMAFTSIPFADALSIGILFRVATFWSGLLIGYGCLTTLKSGGHFSTERMKQRLQEMK